LSLLVLVAWPLTEDSLVGAVVRADQIVLWEGCCGDRLRTMKRAVVSTALERFERSLVGAFADVPFAGARAARDDPGTQAVFVGKVAKHHFCHGRAADVSRAYEDDAEGFRRSHASILPSRAGLAQPRNVFCTLALVCDLSTARGWWVPVAESEEASWMHVQHRCCWGLVLRQPLGLVLGAARRV